MDNGGGRKAPERGRDRAEFEVAAVTAIRYCLRDMSIRRQDAEDCEAEFVLKILRLIAREREPSGAAPRTAAADPAWLRRCAQNHAIDFLRAARRRRAREVSEEDGTWSEAQRALPA